MVAKVLPDSLDIQRLSMRSLFAEIATWLSGDDTTEAIEIHSFSDVW
jgi:hypothetical protein